MVGEDVAGGRQAVLAKAGALRLAMKRVSAGQRVWQRVLRMPWIRRRKVELPSARLHWEVLHMFLEVERHRLVLLTLLLGLHRLIQLSLRLQEGAHASSQDSTRDA